MRSAHGINVLRAFILLALGTSIALLLDYTTTDPAFCGVDSGCSALRESGFGYVPLFGAVALPVPLLGVLAFSSLLLLSFTLHQRTLARLFYGAVTAGALIALVLIGIQFNLGSMCSLCMAIDLSMLLIAALTYVLKRNDAIVETSPVFTKAAWAALLGLTLLGPLLYPRLVHTHDVPAVITDLYKPGKITVLEFFDFECPHCRDLSPRLKNLVDEIPTAHIRYGYTPLPGHEAAHLAARLCICAAEQEKEHELAAALFALGDFSESKVSETAAKLVPDNARLSACLASKRPDDRIMSDITALRSAGFVGLPTTYIGGLRILGAETDAVYQDALLQVQEGRDRSGMPAWAYWLSAVSLLLVVLYFGRTPQGATPATKPS